MVTEIVVLLLLLTILVVLVILMSDRKDRSRERGEKAGDLGDFKTGKGKLFGTKCPLCGEWLEPGEKVHSHLYPGKPDGMMHIFGCPRCYSGHPDRGGRGGSGRICPYCHESLGPEDYVIARVFERPDKTQVHVLGCTICRDKR
ncbi:MAG: hypothetical protein PQJ60_13665 [Spirochaetales bacterium]|nr:hypothetical protein [Spirochaetales bacterium]